jgi:hypothetical protein
MREGGNEGRREGGNEGMREGMKPIPSRPPPLKEEELFFLKGHSPLSLTPKETLNK